MDGLILIHKFGEGGREMGRECGAESFWMIYEDRAEGRMLSLPRESNWRCFVIKIHQAIGSDRALRLSAHLASLLINNSPRFCRIHHHQATNAKRESFA